MFQCFGDIPTNGRGQPPLYMGFCQQAYFTRHCFETGQSTLDSGYRFRFLSYPVERERNVKARFSFLNGITQILEESSRRHPCFNSLVGPTNINIDLGSKLTQQFSPTCFILLALPVTQPPAA